jgi:hypothetical protein
LGKARGPAGHARRPPITRQPAAYPLVIMPADFVVSRRMLLGVKARAERTTGAGLHGDPPALKDPSPARNEPTDAA